MCALRIFHFSTKLSTQAYGAIAGVKLNVSKKTSLVLVEIRNVIALRGIKILGLDFDPQLSDQRLGTRPRPQSSTG